MNDRVGVAAVYEANLSTPTAEWPRVLLQKAAKSLGLPATGSKERIMRYIRIATDDPRTWSREDFNLILPHLSIHQDVRGQANVLDVLRVGLLRGMVDPAGGLEPGGNQWTWARGYLGTDVYVFITCKLKYIGRANPRLASGNTPMFHAKPARFGSLWSAIRAGAITRPASTLGTVLSDPDHFQLGLAPIPRTPR